MKAPSVCLIGPPGVGKTRSLVTAIAAGLELRAVLTEPGAVDTIMDTMRELKLPQEKLKYQIVSPVAAGWSGLRSMVDLIGKNNYEELTKLKSGVDKARTSRAIAFLDAFANFTDDRTGESFGDVTTWGDDVMLALDSLSGFNVISRNHTVGLKPTMHEGEWGVAMELQKALIKQLVDECQCFFTLTAHVDKEPDLVGGGFVNTVAALGKKNAPQIIKDFSEVVLCKRQKGEFFWSTSEIGTDVKNRALPISDRIIPHFQILVDAHRRRKETAAAA